MEDSRGLLKELEPLFQDEAVLIAAFQVEKPGQGGDATGTQLLKSLGAKAYRTGGPKLRVIAFSVKRSLTDRGFSASIHICRRQDDDSANSPLEVRKTYPLKCLHDMRLSRGGKGGATALQGGGAHAHALSQGGRPRPSDTDAAGGGAPVLELSLAQHHSVPEHRGAYLAADLEQAMFVMSLAVQLLRQQDAVQPSLAGVSMDRLDAWWTAHRDLVTASLAPFASEVVTPGTVQITRRDAPGVLVSAKEEADLEELLGMFALGLGEPEEFAARLQDEHAALEAANVYGLLESGPLVDGVLGQLRRTQGILDDLDESLKVFDFKLRHMRDDIAAIEASNNTLERQSRHNAALLEALDRLLSDLALDPSVASTLEGAALDPNRLNRVVAAAWALHDKQRRLSPTGGPGAINPLMCGMRAVKDARAKLDGLAQRFVGRAVQHICSMVTQLAGEAMNERGGGGGGAAERAARLAPPDRGRLREALLRHRDLVAVVAALDQGALSKLQLHYAQTVNGLIRRELRGCSSELRRGAQADAAAGGGGDFTLAAAREKSAFGSIRRPPRPSTGSYSDASDPGSAAASPRAPRGAGGAAAGGAAARAAAYAAGAAPGLPLHAAWQQLLGSFLPFLLDEADFAADLFLMRKGDDPQPPGAGRQQHGAQQQGAGGARRDLTLAGRVAVDSLLGSLEQDFMVVVDMTGKGSQVMCIPMLATTRAWLARLKSRPSSGPLAACLSAADARLGANWSAFVAAQAGAVDAYDGRSKIGLQGGIKNMHLLPFVGQFVAMALEVEALFADAVAEAGGRAAGRARRNAQRRQRTRQQQEERERERGSSGGGGEDEGGGAAAAERAEAAEDEAAERAAASARAEVDGAYSALAGRIFACLERQAAGDAKYADRLRLENYGHFADELSPLTNNAAALRESVQQADARREGAIAQYIRDMLDWGKLWRLLEFGEKLEKLLQVVSPPEVAFQKDCSANEVRSLVRSVMDGADKKLDALHGRVRKHLGATPLADAIWGRLKEDLLARYERLEGLLERCYANMPLRPSPEELRELFKLAGSG